jgi:hypothetical protein
VNFTKHFYKPQSLRTLEEKLRTRFLRAKADKSSGPLETGTSLEAMRLIPPQNNLNPAF